MMDKDPNNLHLAGLMCKPDHNRRNAAHRKVVPLDSVLRKTDGAGIRQQLGIMLDGPRFNPSTSGQCTHAAQDDACMRGDM
jgi:hypothetical protein